ncbi:hypothetical protein D1B31_07605 [Neobacillus notoginsengisoli]|uniref:Uncharacterized protein n=1 Tax=Neobacillus notoginsengisoli TaxID=1578198 RepID=A0A417YW74_9BACI|nr:hypothetical protein [Neobacillus notoginsengisoli]RHW41574.1 hypothetical protein D1B31_07605 [Neobacillus notoginsengisoli]
MKWIEVKDQNDIEYLLDTFGRFHDSCLKEMYLWTNHSVDEDLGMSVSAELDTNIRILFQRQFRNPSAIEMVFEGVTQMHIVPSPINYDSIIYEGKIILYRGLLYWTDDSDWKPYGSSSRANWISASRLRWRDASSWMGRKNRYGVMHQDNETLASD